MDGCQIYIEGQDTSTYNGWYYIGCNSVQYITDQGYNSSASSITAYQSISTDGNRGNRVVFPSYSLPYYQSSSGYNYSYFSIASVRFNSVGYLYREKELIDLFVLFILSVFLIMRLFRS